MAALAFLLIPTCRSLAADCVWNASFGILPQDACPPWTFATSDSIPAFSAGALRIHTTACAMNAVYLQQGADIAVPDTIVVEARLRMQARGECEPCGTFRDGSWVAITTGPGVGILFFIGVDQIILTDGECAGIIAASVDTDGAFHTYRVVILPSGGVHVSYDGAPALSGHTYSSFSDHGSEPRIVWGEGSSFAYGTSYWESVRHNMHATGCATSGAAAPVGSRAASTITRVVPNPFNPLTTIAFDLPQPADVKLAVFDITGRLVRVLVDEERQAGSHDVVWNGLNDRGRRVASGVYFCRLEAGPSADTRRLTMLK